jgi:hypothetical protein
MIRTVAPHGLTKAGTAAQSRDCVMIFVMMLGRGLKGSYANGEIVFDWWGFVLLSGRSTTNGYWHEKTSSGSFASPSRRARALMARPWSARCYGVARPREGSRQNSIGQPRLPNLLPSTRARGAPPRDEPPVSYGVSARGCSRSRLARGPRVIPFVREGADGQAVVCPLLRGSSPTRGVAPKQHRGPAFPFSANYTPARPPKTLISARRLPITSIPERTSDASRVSRIARHGNGRQSRSMPGLPAR